MAVSETFIANLALDHLGRATIGALTETSPEAIACQRHYEFARDFVLSDRDWRFNRARAALALLTNDRPKEWAYKYQRPNPCLRFRYLLGPSQLFDPRLPERYEIEGQAIYADAPEAVGVYSGRVTDVTLYPMAFVEALGWYLAHKVAMPLTQSQDLMAMALQGYNAAKGKAAAIESHEEVRRPDAFETQADWITARGGAWDGLYGRWSRS